MIKEMNYDEKFISLMTELASINPTLIFRKNEDGDKITFKAIENTDKSICYILDADKDAFSFESDSLFPTAPASDMLPPLSYALP